MKINRRNPRHWILLALFGANVVAAVLLRWLVRESPSGCVLLYGHKLNGNLAAIREHALADGFQSPMVFLTMDPSYHRQLLSEGIPSLLAISPRCILRLARARAIISDHGLHALELLARLTRIGLFDVWHGIPFKGFDPNDFAVQHHYDEAWVASPLLKSLYVEKFGFKPDRVAVTGYARTDALVAPTESIDDLRARLGLERIGGRKVLLFAPTWKQDSEGRSLFPFGATRAQFFAGLEQVCREEGAVVLFRAHLNSDEVPSAGDYLISVPHARFPDTEAILRLSDVLVCDWSSIAFDFLLLDRPTIFLDVEPPFAKGFSLGWEYRFGAIVTDMPSLLARIAECLRTPEAYCREFSSRHAHVREQVYGSYADGKSARRCLDQLQSYLAKAESSR